MTNNEKKYRELLHERNMIGYRILGNSSLPTDKARIVEIEAKLKAKLKALALTGIPLFNED